MESRFCKCARVLLDWASTPAGEGAGPVPGPAIAAAEIGAATARCVSICYLTNAVKEPWEVFDTRLHVSS